MNRYPLQPHPKRWNARLSPWFVRTLQPFRQRKLRVEQRLEAVHVHGIEAVRNTLASNEGVLITPNHPAHADAYSMNAAADAVGTPFYYMTAWQVFATRPPIARWVLSRHGCFSVDREAADREAFRTAVGILQEAHNPLVIFPEGEVYHQNDRVTPFREGAAAMAIMAARKSERPIVAVPCAIRYRYLEDPTPALLTILDQLEESIHWRPRPDLSMRQRIYRLAEGLISLKEIEYLGATQDSVIGLRERVARLADSILSEVESRFDLGSPNHNESNAIPERVKAVRAEAIARLGNLEEHSSSDPDVRQQIAHALDDVFLVVQLYSYPGDYLTEDASIERIAETIDKLEEDVLGRPTATVRAKRDAVVTFGESVPVSAGADASSDARGEKPRRWTAATLTRQLEQDVQHLLDCAGS